MARQKAFDPQEALDKALDLFWLQGYEATSVQQLCSAMGIQKGSLYATFGDKRALFFAALDRYVSSDTTIADAVAVTDTARATIEQIFMGMVAASVDDAECRGCMVVNTIVELAAVDPEIADFSTANRQGYETMFHQLLERAQREGNLAAQHDLRGLARYLVNAMYGLRVTAKTTRDPALLHDIVRTTLSILA